MAVFDYSFTVRTPLAEVAAFHHDPQALKRLTPPPIFVQMHKAQPLSEGSVAEFTLWFGPFPIRWVAVHTGVDPLHGFTDTQQRGLMKSWVHTHTFTAEGEDVTRIRERVEYEHHVDLRGLISRLLFSRLALWLLFTYRRFATRRALENSR